MGRTDGVLYTCDICGRSEFSAKVRGTQNRGYQYFVCPYPPGWTRVMDVGIMCDKCEPAFLEMKEKLIKERSAETDEKV